MAKNSTSKPGKSPDHELIRELAELLTETGLSEIEIEHSDMRIRVARTLGQGAGVQSTTVQVPATIPAAQPASPSATTAMPVEETAHPGAVPSPMIGTVYLAPEPGAAPFIKVGQQIEEGQTLMIVEAMKTMNHIPSPRSGKITAILIENQQPVEFGEPLLIIE